MIQQEVVSVTPLVFLIFTVSVIQLSTHHLPSKYTHFALVYMIDEQGKKQLRSCVYLYVIICNW